MSRTELGCPGHFIAVSSCQWRRHTEVNGRYRVSSVGDYYPDRDGRRKTIGSGTADFFETMVFRLTKKLAGDPEKCGCHEVAEWPELDGERYATAGAAQAGHERYVRKYLRRKS